MTVDIASGKTTPLASRICDTDDTRLTFEGRRVTAQSLADPGVSRTAPLRTRLHGDQPLVDTTASRKNALTSGSLNLS